MTSPKAKALSNHEIVTLAVFLLGGDSKRIDMEDDCFDLTDPIVEIREALNRITRKAASLYAQ